MKRLVQPGTVRVPGARLLVNGTVLPAIKSADVHANSHYQADTFTVKLALNAAGGKDLPWWGADTLKGQLFDVRLKLDDVEKSMIIGEADRIRIHPDKGEVDIEGRDLTARLIEARTQEAYLNKTSSEVATLLAQRHGLTPVVTATNTLVQRYYGNDHDRVQHGQFSKVSTEWDLLTWLAKFEGFDCFVSGTELHFQPTADASKAEPYAVTWHNETKTGNITNLVVERSLTLAKDVVVIVKSWHSGQGRGFTRSSPGGWNMAKVKGGKAQSYVFVRPNLQEDQAQKWADQLREWITRNQRELSFDCPGELDLTPRDILQLSGVGSGWDQKFYINTVSRRWSFDEGATQSVTAKNHNVDTQVAGP